MATESAGARWVMPVSLFCGTFAWSFVYVSLPFYIERVSTLDGASTLRWTGWILGITPLVTVATAPLWGRLAGRGSPKTLYVTVELLQGAGFFLMAMARTLPELLLARLVLGVMGAASTFAFIIAGRGGGDVRREVSAIQSAMTVGQVVGPLAGAVAAERIGFQPSFALGGLILWGCSALVWRGVPDRPRKAAGDGRAGTASLREIGAVSLLVLAGSTQVFFLTAILPQVLPPLGVAAGDTLHVGGLVLFATGVAAALGALGAPRLGELIGERRTVPWVLAASSLLLAALALAPGVWGFGALRFLQVLCIAPVFPLAVAGIAHRASGEAIGFVNSSRIGASFLGPVIATNLLTLVPPGGVYLVLAALGLAAVPLVAGASRRPAAGEGMVR